MTRSAAPSSEIDRRPASARAPRRAALPVLALSLGLASACTDDLGGRGGDDELDVPGGDGKQDGLGLVADTCLQYLADGHALEPTGCTAERVAADFAGSPLGQVATLLRVQPVSLPEQPGKTYLDLELCDARVNEPDRPLWAPMPALADAYRARGLVIHGEPTAGCQWVPAEDLAGLAFLYLHNSYQPTPATQEAAWRFFHHYPDTLAYLFTSDPNFSFSFVNRHIQAYLDAHPGEHEDTASLVDAYVVATWGTDFADVVLVNNNLNMMPTTLDQQELVGEFLPPLPNRLARQTLQTMNDAWNGPDKLVVRLVSAYAMSELNAPFVAQPQYTPPDARLVNRLQDGLPVAVAVDRAAVPADPGPALLNASYDDAVLRLSDPVTGSIATTADFDSFYELLMADGKVNPSVSWQMNTVGEPVGTEPPEDKFGFHLEYVLGQDNPAETETLIKRAGLLVNGRADGLIAKTVPNAPRGVLLEEMFHTSQWPRPKDFNDPLNFKYEIEFREFALANAERYGFAGNADQIAVWQHEKFFYEFVRDTTLR